MKVFFNGCISRHETNQMINPLTIKNCFDSIPRRKIPLEFVSKYLANCAQEQLHEQSNQVGAFERMRGFGLFRRSWKAIPSAQLWLVRGVGFAKATRSAVVWVTDLALCICSGCFVRRLRCFAFACLPALKNRLSAAFLQLPFFSSVEEGKYLSFAFVRLRKAFHKAFAAHKMVSKTIQIDHRLNGNWSRMGQEATYRKHLLKISNNFSLSRSNIKDVTYAVRLNSP